MKGNRAVLTAIVILVIAVAGWWLFHRGSAASAVDLLAQFDQAKKRRRGRSASNDATLAGDTKKAIAAPPNGRITSTSRVPDDGWLKVSLGMKPEAWDKEGNGVYSSSASPTAARSSSCSRRRVNPFANPAERRWIPVTVDLSAYAGEEMEIIFNTRDERPGQPADSRNDLPLWGAPEIVTR